MSVVGELSFVHLLKTYNFLLSEFYWHWDHQHGENLLNDKFHDLCPISAINVPDLVSVFNAKDMNFLFGKLLLLTFE